MASLVYTVQDALDAVRSILEDDAQRRIDDTEVLLYHVPRTVQQLHADRPSVFVGHVTFGAENFKLSAQDPLPFADQAFDDFVEALIASIQSKEDEAVAAGVAGMADAKSQRARKGG